MNWMAKEGGEEKNHPSLTVQTDVSESTHNCRSDAATTEARVSPFFPVASRKGPPPSAAVEGKVSLFISGA